jgi:ubiquinone/menaquinone biosynthesis C-methylase UbiE
MPGGDYWDTYIHAVGHTSYSDTFKRRYDRPLRMKAIRKQVESITSRFPQTRDALDFGCGEGDIVALLRGQGLAVTGVDVSAGTLSIARQRFADDPEAEFYQSEPDRLPVNLGNFDLCTAIDVFQNIGRDENLAEMLSLIRNVMTPNGRVLTLEIATSPKLVTSEAPMRERTPDQWRDIYGAAGFQIETETVYALWGITLVQQFDRLLGRLQPGNRQFTRVDDSGGVSARNTGFPRRMARFAAKNIRRTILIGMWPFDYVFKIPAPRRWSFHRIFVLKISD